MMQVIDSKDILGWCFTIGALNFGVLGFLYSTYAAASFGGPDRPPIVKFLRLFCRAVAFVLVALTLLALHMSYSATVPWPVWVIVGCFVVLAAFSAWLVLHME